MKKIALKIIVVLIVMFLIVPISVVLAESNATVECVLDITHDEYESGVFYWLGTLSDCDLAGTIRFDAVGDEYAFPGKTMHFVELFTIYPGCETQECDEYIKGKNWGVWNFSTFKFRANGWVMDASPEWEHLIGSKYHEMGTTSPYYDDNDIPITTLPGGAMRLVPAQRPPHALP